MILFIWSVFYVVLKNILRMGQQSAKWGRRMGKSYDHTQVVGKPSHVGIPRRVEEEALKLWSRSEPSGYRPLGHVIICLHERINAITKLFSTSNIRLSVKDRR